MLDVRTRREFTSGHLAGAVNIPLDEPGPYLAGGTGARRRAGLSPERGR